MITEGRHKRSLLRLLTIVVALGFLSFLALDAAAQASGGPSAFCHVTDGIFTVCPDGNAEWSDVTTQFFPESQSYLYADQTDLDPNLASPNSPVDTFMLMYDECGRTTPFGPDEYFRVSFTTVEEESGVEKLEHYVIHIFTDGTIIFFEDGELETDGEGNFRVEEIEGQRGKVGFGPSPNCPFDHVIAEFEIGLTAAEVTVYGAYSPDPQFWGAAPPPPPRRKIIIALFTGFSGSSGDNIGIEQIRQQLLQRQDVDVVVQRFGHSQQRRAVNFIRSNLNEAEIVLIGHSLGGDSTTEVARRLNKEGLTVDRLVQIGSVGIGDETLPGNATTGLNFFQTSTGMFEPQGAMSVSGSTNVDAEAHLGLEADELTHTEIDNTTTIQGEVVDFAVDSVLPLGPGVTPQMSPTRNIAVLDPLIIDGLAGLVSNTAWDSGFIPLGSPVSLDGDDGIIIDVEFANTVALQMTDATGLSPETLTVRLFGTGVVPDQNTGGESSDVVEVEFQFDDFSEELLTNQTTGHISISSTSGTGIFQGLVNLTDSEFLFGGFTLEILQNGTGLVEINGIRVSLEADAIVEATEPPPPPVGITNGTFETCTLDGWDVAPSSIASAITSLGPAGSFTPILPPEGECMAFLSTAGFAPTPPGTRGSVISQTFVVPDDVSTLGFCYQYVSNDSSSFENFFLAELDTSAGTFTLGSADNAGGSPAGGFVPPPPPLISAGVTLTPDQAPVFLSGVNILGSSLFIIPSSLITERVCSLFDIPPEVRGTVITLRFSAGDALDTGVESAVVIDVVGFDGILPLPGDGDGDGVEDELDNCPATPNPLQEDSDLNGIGNACQTPNLQNSTAAFLQAGTDGSSVVEPRPLPVEEEPPLSERIVRIVEFRVQEGLTDNPEELTNNLVNSVVDVGLVPPEEADALVDEVLEQIGQNLVCELKVKEDVAESLHFETFNTDENLEVIWNVLFGVNPPTSPGGIVTLQADQVVIWQAGTLEMGGVMKLDVKTDKRTGQKEIKIKKAGKKDGITTLGSGTGGVNPNLADGGWHEVKIKNIDNVTVTFDGTTVTGFLKELKVKLDKDSTTGAPVVKDFKIDLRTDTPIADVKRGMVTAVVVEVPETTVTALAGIEYEEKVKDKPEVLGGHTEAEYDREEDAVIDGVDIAALSDGFNDQLKERKGACTISTP